MGDGCVLDFLTNLCGLPLMSAVPLVPGFVAAGARTRAELFALTDCDLKERCGVANAAQRKKVRCVCVCASVCVCMHACKYACPHLWI